MIQNNPVGQLASAYLKKCGYPVEKINSWTSETRLLHDIGLCGDSILDDFKILQDEFDVDLSDFEFKKYFPTELSTESLLLTLRPLLRAVGLQWVVNNIYHKYPEVTLGMIESTIRLRKWVSERDKE